MAAQNNQKLKILALLRILETETDDEQGLTMPQLIERLAAQGISAERKSVYRDLTALREAGFSIEKLPTRPVSYGLVRSALSLDDVMMLVDAVQSSRFLSERRSSQLVKRLKGLVSQRQRRQLDKRIHVRDRIKNQSDSVFRNVDCIHGAMKAKRKIEFLYFSYGPDLERHARHDGKRYILTPVSVVFSDGYYYLAAYDDVDDKIKTYRIDRMELLQQSDQVATRCPTIANYCNEDFAYRSFSMFSGEGKTVTLKVQAPFMDAVVDRFGSEVEVVKAEKSAAKVRVRVQLSPQFFGWLAGLSGGVSLCAPKKACDAYRQWLEGLLAS